MRELKETVDAAIRASGKTGKEIAKKLGVDENTISRIRTGESVNPGVQVLQGIARETGTTVATLLDEGSLTISAEDANELQRIRGWIDSKLANIDALRDPNAEIVAAPSVASSDLRIADRPSQRADAPFGADARLLLRALGESMIEDGILPDDTLYAKPAESTNAWPVGSIIACRSGHDIFIKRLVSEHGRLFLVSAHRRYLAIAVDASFEFLGTVIGRIGRLR